MGPTVGILLREPLDEHQVDQLEQWLIRIAGELTGDRKCWEFWAADGSAVPMPCNPGDRPFCLSVVPFGKEAVGPGELIDILDDTEIAEYESALGYVPREEIAIWAGCNGKEDHLTLGYLAVRLAREHSGLIDMGGAITPPLQQDGEYDPWQRREEIRALVRTLPGTVYELGAETRSLSHVVDVDFFQAWLAHPHFHMIK